MFLDRLFYGFIRNSIRYRWISYAASCFAAFLYINVVTVLLAFDQIAKRNGWLHADYDKYYFISAGLFGAFVAFIEYHVATSLFLKTKC